MLLGKRLRPPMNRTTSMTELPSDLAAPGATQPANKERTHRHQRERQRAVGVPDDDWLEARYGTTPPPRGITRRSSGDFAAIETATFLKACGLCKRRLGPGKDIFMYRGHIAFCSLECRQQQINQDERKEKCSTTSRKKDATQSTAESSNNGETMASA